MTGLDLLDPASPLRLEPAHAGEPAADVVATPRIGIAYAGAPWTDVPWRFVDAGQPGRLRSAAPRPALTPMDARSIALLEFPLVRERLAAAHVVPAVRSASRRRSSHRPTRSSSPAASTRPTRPGRS